MPNIPLAWVSIVGRYDTDTEWWSKAFSPLELDASGNVSIAGRPVRCVYDADTATLSFRWPNNVLPGKAASGIEGVISFEMQPDGTRRFQGNLRPQLEDGPVGFQGKGESMSRWAGQYPLLSPTGTGSKTLRIGMDGSVRIAGAVAKVLKSDPLNGRLVVEAENNEWVLALEFGDGTAVATAERMSKEGADELYVGQRARSQLPNLNNLSCRSVLAEEYPDPTKPGEASFRSILTVPRDIETVRIGAEAPIDILINEKPVSLSTTGVEVTPNVLRKIVINVPPTSLSQPYLTVDTGQNLGGPYTIFPDAPAHQKLAKLPDGALYQGRDALGVSDKSENACAAVQASVSNLAKSVQHTYIDTGIGVCHDAYVRPQNMDNPHWMLDLSGAEPVHKALTVEDIKNDPAIQNAKRIDNQIAQSFFGDIGHFLSKATHIVVHTVEHAGGDLVHSAEQPFKDAFEAAKTAGEDLVHGDIGGMAGAIIGGFGKVDKDLLAGGEAAGKDLLKGGGQLAMATIKLGDDAFQFALNHTGIVGELIKHVFDKIGVAFEKLGEWLMSKLDWGAILHTQKVLANTANDGFGRLQAMAGDLKSGLDSVFNKLESKIDEGIDHAINHLDSGQPPPQNSLVHDAVEALDWLVSKLANHSEHDATMVVKPPEPGSPLDLVVSDIKTALSGAPDITEAFGDAINDFADAITAGSKAPEDIAIGFLELFKGSADLLITVPKAFVDVSIETTEELGEAFQKELNAPIDVPFLSELFATVTKSKPDGQPEGDPLTVINLSALLAAIPATLSCQIVLHRNPFDGVDSLSMSENGDWQNAISWAAASVELVNGILATLLDGLDIANAKSKLIGFLECGTWVLDLISAVLEEHQTGDTTGVYEGIKEEKGFADWAQVFNAASVSYAWWLLFNDLYGLILSSAVETPGEGEAASVGPQEETRPNVIPMNFLGDSVSEGSSDTNVGSGNAISMIGGTRRWRRIQTDDENALALYAAFCYSIAVILEAIAYAYNHEDEPWELFAAAMLGYVQGVTTAVILTSSSKTVQTAAPVVDGATAIAIFVLRSKYDPGD